MAVVLGVSIADLRHHESTGSDVAGIFGLVAGSIGTLLMLFWLAIHATLAWRYRRSPADTSDRTPDRGLA